MKNQKDIEAVTANLFPRIHLKNTDDDLQRYQKKIRNVIQQYADHFELSESDMLDNKNILEVGCGGRSSGITALEHYSPNSITAVDLSKKNVANSLDICKKFNFSNVNIEQGNALKLRFNNDSFDVVFSNGVIHHTTNPYKCFLELVRVLKPGGFLFLGIYGYGGLWGKVIHPLGMMWGKIIPLNFTEKIVNLTGILKSQENSILDWFYTPIQKKYRICEILNWFEKNGLDNTINIKSPKWFYNMGALTTLFFGDSYIFAIGRKKKSS